MRVSHASPLFTSSATREKSPFKTDEGLEEQKKGVKNLESLLIEGNHSGKSATEIKDAYRQYGGGQLVYGTAKTDSFNMSGKKSG